MNLSLHSFFGFRFQSLAALALLALATGCSSTTTDVPTTGGHDGGGAECTMPSMAAGDALEVYRDYGGYFSEPTCVNHSAEELVVSTVQYRFEGASGALHLDVGRVHACGTDRTAVHATKDIVLSATQSASLRSAVQDLVAERVTLQTADWGEGTVAVIRPGGAREELDVNSSDHAQIGSCAIRQAEYEKLVSTLRGLLSP